MHNKIVSSDMVSMIIVLFDSALFVWTVYAINYQLNAFSTYVGELAESILFLFYQFWWTVG